MGILREKEYWLTVLIFTLFVIYQFLGIWNYYTVQFADTKPHQVVEMIINNVDLAFYLTILWQVFFIFIVHLVAATFAYFLWKYLSFNKRIKNNYFYFFSFMVGILLLSVLWNRVLFPNSISFEWSDLLLLQTYSKAFFYILNGMYLALFFIALYFFLSQSKVKSHIRTNRFYYTIVAISGVLFFTLSNINFNTQGVAGKAYNTNPNIIFIGIDSLRLDKLGYFGFQSGLTSNIDSFLEDAVVFSDTLTPVARTFPAWLSILSGKYPVHHGGRFNLYPRSKVLKDSLLPKVLQNKGYKTYYLTDEVRFANFTSEYGFDILNTPKMGIFDFSLGATLDFVFLNLLTKIDAFSGLFPYTYANRAAKSIYEPETFISRATDTVENIDTKPFFMAAHHCLPHWPYFNQLQGSEKQIVKRYKKNTDVPLRYLNALYLADKQVGNLLHQLKKAGLLENSIVVMLSDHGESLGASGDAMVVKGGADVPYGMGHGTFALSLIQHRVLLAMQRYVGGIPRWQSGKRLNKASLIDIAPTISSLLSINLINYDGNSLLPYIMNNASPAGSRLRYTESGLTSSIVDTKNPDEAKLFKEYSGFYEINNELVQLNPEYLEILLDTKQRAVIKENTALLHRKNIYIGEQWLYADYSNNSVMEVADPDGFSEDTKYMKHMLCQQFSSDTNFYENSCQTAE